MLTATKLRTKLMSDKIRRNDLDIIEVLGLLLVFGLTLTLFIPGFSIWDVIPRLRVSRCHILIKDLTWRQTNIVIVVKLLFFFCLYLDFRKRKLDEMVERVLTVSQATDSTMEIERERQALAMKACMKLLDASTEHYEDLVLLSNELRKRDVAKQQKPPTIELSTSEL